MSLFKKITDFLFGKTIVINDPFFGEMTDAGSYYECKKLFKPTGKIVEIGLEKKDTPPDDLQINFFYWIENNYETIIENIKPKLQNELANWPAEININNFDQEFRLEYLYIPKCDKEVFDWKITFYGEKELHHWCTLEMHGFQVISLLIDG